MGIIEGRNAEEGPASDDALRAELEAAVAARLDQVAREQSPAHVLDPDFTRQVRQLAALLSDAGAELGSFTDARGLQSRLLLGLVHWYRYCALPEGPGQLDLLSAITMLTPYFLYGDEPQGLPAPLRAALADQATPLADRMQQQALPATDSEMITATVSLWKRIVKFTPTANPDRARRLANLGTALRERFIRAGQMTDLDEAIDNLRLAVTASPAEDGSRPMMQASLGAALRTRFLRTGELGDVDEAIDNLRQAVAETSSETCRSEFQDSLGLALRARLERTGEEEDQRETADLELSAASATFARHAHGLAPDNLDETVRLWRARLTMAPVGHPARGTVAFYLGAALQARYERTEMLADISDAVAAARVALDATAADSPNTAPMLANLGIALQELSDRAGRLADMDEAITVLRQAAAGSPRDHPNWAATLSNLGVALRSRYMATQSMADLDEAVESGRQALADVPAGHPELAVYEQNLCAALETRFARTGALTDLDEAVRMGQASVAGTPSGDPGRSSRLSSLGVCLRARFNRTGTLSDLDEAISVLHQAIATTPSDRPNRAGVLSNLGLALRARFIRTAERTDLDDAITTLRQASAATPFDHPERAWRLFDLGGTLHMRLPLRRAVVDLTDHGSRSGGADAQADFDEAIESLCGAVDTEFAAPSVRIRAARGASALITESDPAQAAALLAKAVRMLPEVAPRQLARSDQQYALGGLSGLASDAAALALSDSSTSPGDRAGIALQLLEAGRATLFSQALEVRSDLTDLADQHPDLAARFTRLRDLLDQAPGQGHPADERRHSAQGQDEADGSSHLMTDRRQLAEDLSAVLSEIRADPAFASFALPPTQSELLRQSLQGPVVVFNVSGHRSDALLLASGQISSVTLPALAHSTVVSQIDNFRQALRAAAHGRTSAERISAEQTLNNILQWLWDAAVGPVLDTLQYTGPPARDAPWPRVWWAPGGLMAQLPLHAAGYHSSPAADQGNRSAIDRVISSYTPTINALQYARRAAAPPAEPTAPALIVAMPTTPELPYANLGFVVHEARMLATLLPGAITLTEPDPVINKDGAGDGPRPDPKNLPTSANVLAHLPTCPIVHFACHGTSDPADPSHSRLLLHDHRTSPFTVTTVATLRLDHAHLAFLSACDTAVANSAALIDEAIHLASGFQLAGYRNVIGTLWTISDVIATDIANTFYTAITSDDPPHPATALHHALKTVRAKLPDRPSLWASHIHAGA